MLPVRAELERVVPLRSGAFFGVSYSRDKPVFAYFDSAGRERRKIAHPSWLDSIPTLVSELRLASSPDRDWIAIGSHYSGRLMRTEREKSEMVEMNAVEKHPFPVPISFSPRAGMTVRRFPPSARSTIRSLAADKRFVYALVSGRTPQRGRLVDRYRLADGAYVDSFALPRVADAISIAACGLAFLVSDPLPAIHCAPIIR